VELIRLRYRRDVGEILIKEGLAVPYNGGGKRRDWCNG
jgi:hypothetical protein